MSRKKNRKRIKKAAQQQQAYCVNYGLVESKRHGDNLTIRYNLSPLLLRDYKNSHIKFADEYVKGAYGSHPYHITNVKRKDKKEHIRLTIKVKFNGGSGSAGQKKGPVNIELFSETFIE